METPFSRELSALIVSEGNAAVEAIGDLHGSTRLASVLSESLRWLGRLEDGPTRATRLWLLEAMLQHPAVAVRDGAALGLASLGDTHACAALRQAIAQEPIGEFRADLQQILDDLTSGP
jgi:hypothetical protein